MKVKIKFLFCSCYSLEWNEKRVDWRSFKKISQSTKRTNYKVRHVLLYIVPVSCCLISRAEASLVLMILAFMSMRHSYFYGGLHLRLHYFLLVCLYLITIQCHFSYITFWDSCLSSCNNGKKREYKWHPIICWFYVRSLCCRSDIPSNQPI